MLGSYFKTTSSLTLYHLLEAQNAVFFNLIFKFQTLVFCILLIPQLICFPIKLQIPYLIKIYLLVLLMILLQPHPQKLSHLMISQIVFHLPKSQSSPNMLLHLKAFNIVSQPPSHLHDCHGYSDIISLHKPNTFQKVKSDPLWHQSIAEELQALERTHTWDLVDLSLGKSIVGTNGFTKPIPNLIILLNIIRLGQLPWTSPKSMTLIMKKLWFLLPALPLRNLLVVATIRHQQLFQIDAKNVFLNENIEEMYMQPPPSYDHPS